MASLAGPLDSGMVLKAELRWDWLNIFASLDTPMQLRKKRKREREREREHRHLSKDAVTPLNWNK